MNSLKLKITILDRTRLIDDRGWFLKALTGKEENLPEYTGEVYITSAKPNSFRGGHYHKEATEWFTLLTGKALLRLSDVETNEKMEILLDSAYPQTIVIPPFVAHSFVNQSDSDYILLAYTDLLYNPEDTVAYSI